MSIQITLRTTFACGMAMIMTLFAIDGMAQADPLNVADYLTAPLVTSQGKVYRIVRGNAYEVVGTLLRFRSQVYDPDFYVNNYRQDGGITYRYVDAQTKFPVRTSMSEGFENATSIRDLVNPTRGWNSITLQGPGSPTVGDYVRLRKSILEQGGSFIDNRVEPSSAVVRSGSKSLRAYALPAGGSLDVSKASLESALLHFRKGDHFWFTGYYYIASGTPIGILDLESSYLPEYAGVRILLSSTLQPRVELKWADKPTYSSIASAVLPRNQWVYVRLHVYLSDGADGRIELWVNGSQVINATGQTLPLPDSVYDRLEVGISANQAGTAEVFLDDLKFDHRSLF